MNTGIIGADPTRGCPWVIALSWVAGVERLAGWQRSRN